MKILNFDKMTTELVDGVAQYSIGVGENTINLNLCLGKKLRLSFKKEIHCTHCGQLTKKSYSGGYCYPCSARLPECDMCILKPELCHYSLGTCRDPVWGQANCMSSHFVYLSNSSGLKVGITRANQIPTRWIDQGAVAGLPVLKVSTRYQSGVFEKLFSSEIKDKTDWRKMLKGNIEEIDLEEKRKELFDLFPESIDQMEGKFGPNQIEILECGTVTHIKFPVLEYPEKITSLSLDKNEVVEGTLMGIKGQYLIFDTGVINIRTHTGYKVELEFF